MKSIKIIMLIATITLVACSESPEQQTISIEKELKVLDEKLANETDEKKFIEMAKKYEALGKKLNELKGITPEKFDPSKIK